MAVSVKHVAAVIKGRGAAVLCKALELNNEFTELTESEPMQKVAKATAQGVVTKLEERWNDGKFGVAAMSFLINLSRAKYDMMRHLFVDEYDPQKDSE